MLRILRERLRILFKNWHRPSFSQHGEDWRISHYLKDIHKGVYVDVGCFHPRKFSTTKFLYDRGWSGINIDTSPFKIGLFNFDRKRDINLCVAVGDAEGEATLYKFGNLSPLDTLDQETAKEWVKEFGKPYETSKIPCRPLNNILADQNIEYIDYLNIDVEGFEDAVLSGFDIDKYQPKVVTIEVHGDFDAVIASSPYQVFLKHGYKLHAWLRPTVMLVRNDYKSTSF